MLLKFVRLALLSSTPNLKLCVILIACLAIFLFFKEKFADKPKRLPPSAAVVLLVEE